MHVYVKAFDDYIINLIILIPLGIFLRYFLKCLEVFLVQATYLIQELHEFSNGTKHRNRCMMSTPYKNGKEEYRTSKVSVSSCIFKYTIKYWDELK